MPAQEFRTINVATCTLDCPFYRTEAGAPALEHVHLPTFAATAPPSGGKMQVMVPTEHVDAAGAWREDYMRANYPWFFEPGNRAPLATIVP